MIAAFSWENAGAGDRTRMGLPPRDFKSAVAGGKNTEQGASSRGDSRRFPLTFGSWRTISDTVARSVPYGTSALARPSGKRAEGWV